MAIYFLTDTQTTPEGAAGATQGHFSRSDLEAMLWQRHPFHPAGHLVQRLGLSVVRRLHDAFLAAGDNAPPNVAVGIQPIPAHHHHPCRPVCRCSKLRALPWCQHSQHVQKNNRLFSRPSIRSSIGPPALLPADPTSARSPGHPEASLQRKRLRAIAPSPRCNCPAS